MKTTILVPAALVLASFSPQLASAAAPADAERGANQVRFVNNTDDDCQIFLDEVYRGEADPGIQTDWIAVGKDPIKPLNVMVRCGDDGVYAMQLEAVKDACTITFDEEGNGIQAACTNEGIDNGDGGGDGDVDRGVNRFRITSHLDDVCGIWVNGALRGRLDGETVTDWMTANRDNIYRTNILIRCSDGGVYGTSVEAIYDSCEFELDEEGGGLHTVNCQ
jgi:hypothetical protein